MTDNNPIISGRSGSYLEVWNLAYPAILTMLSQTIMWSVDSAMVGRAGSVELAAVGLGGIMVWTMYSFFVGLTNSINTYVSQYFGAGRFNDCSKNLWQGFYIAVISGLLIYAIRTLNPLVVDLLNPAEGVKTRTLAYANIRMLSAPFAFAHFAYSNFFRGIGNTRTPMKVIAFANLVNIVGDYFLIFGKGPFPAMGVAGAAWATAVANLLAALIFFIIFLSRPYREKFSSHKTYRPDLSEIIRLLRVGLPIAVQFLLDMGSFLVFFAYMGRIGTIPLAANQIIIQILSLSFMPCQGFSIAATTLMGQYIGAGSISLARKSAYKTIRLGLLYSTILAALYFLFPALLVEIFSNDPEVIALGKKLILLAAFFQFFDALQMISSGALRGAGDTKAPMLITVGFAWLLFIPLAYTFGSLLSWGAVGAWAGATIYIMILAMVLFFRFRKGAWVLIKV